MEHDIWEVVKAAVQWLLFPLVTSLAFFFRKYIQRVERVENRMNSIETRMAVVETNIAHIKQDLDDIKKDISKILDRLTCQKN